MKKSTWLGLAAAAVIWMTWCAEKGWVTPNSNLGHPVDKTKSGINSVLINDKEKTSVDKNFSIYGAWAKNRDWNFNWIWLKYEWENFILSAEKIEDLKKVSAIFVNKFWKKLLLKSWASYLNKGFDYKWEHFTAKQLKLWMALLYTDNKSYNIELGQIESILRWLDNADTISHITFINWTYKTGNYDISATAKNANVYGDNFTEFSAGVWYYPTEDMRLGTNYSSFNQREWDYSLRGGVTYTFGWKDSWKLSPYLTASYNASDHVTATVNYENNIANKPLHLRDEFGSIINGSDITAQKYNSKEFNKGLDENIRAKNSAPVAKNDVATVQEGQIYNIDVIANDFDPDSNKEPILQDILEKNWDFKINWNKIQFKATTPWVFKCTYQISDSAGEFSKTDTATLTVTVTAKPKPIPETIIDAYNDIFSTKYNTPVSGNVLNNDKKDKDTNAYLTKKPNNWTIIFSENWDFTYTPKSGFEGKDIFEYKITNDKKTDYAKVTINVWNKPAPTNHAPEAKDDSATTQEDTAVSKDVIANDIDQDGDTLSIKAISNEVGWVCSKVSDTVIKFIPNNGFVWNGGCDYTVTDWQATDTASFKVNVEEAPNTAPVLNSVSVSWDTVIDHWNNNYSISKNIDHDITFSANGSDADGDNLQIVINGTIYSWNSATLTLNLAYHEVETFNIKEYDWEEYSNEIIVSIWWV